MSSSMASAASIQHITCLDLVNRVEKSNKTDLSSCQQDPPVKPLHKTVVAVNNYSPVRQSASFTSLSSLTKPLNKGVSFAKFCVQIYSDADEQTMTPCLIVNATAKESLSNPSTLNSSTTNSLAQRSGIKDLNYESGIVSRLRERFSRINNNEVENLETASHARWKRFSSVDDVLATCQVSHNISNNNNHYKQHPISSYSKTQNFWQSVPNSLQTSCSSDSISKTAVHARIKNEKTAVRSANSLKPEARPRLNALMGHKSASNNHTHPSCYSSAGTEEAIYVIVRDDKPPAIRPSSDRQEHVPAQRVSAPSWSHPHLPTSSCITMEHLSRPQERLYENFYGQQQQTPETRGLPKSNVDENTIEPISKLRERFERCNRAQKPDSLCHPLPRSRSAHVYPSTKILENIQKFESGNNTSKKKPEKGGESPRKDARNSLSSSPPADPRPNGFKQIPLLSNKLVEMHEKDSIDEIEPATRLTVVESRSDDRVNGSHCPPEEPRHCPHKTLEEEKDKLENQLTTSPTAAYNVASCDDVDLRLQKSVELKGQPCGTPVSVISQASNESGKLEMQKLLNKFNQKRGAREALKSSNNFVQSQGPTATIQSENKSDTELLKKDEPDSILSDCNTQPENILKINEYSENLMRPDVSKWSSEDSRSSYVEKAATPDLIYAIPTAKADNLREVSVSQSESTTCQDFSLAETCSCSASSTSPSESSVSSNGSQPRKSLSAKYFEEKQRSCSMTSSTSSKSCSESEQELYLTAKESVTPAAKEQPISENAEEKLCQTYSYAITSKTQPTELCTQQQENEPQTEVELNQEDGHPQLELSDPTDMVVKELEKEAVGTKLSEEEIKCLPDVAIENDSTDDGTDSNEDFLTDDFEYSTSLRTSLAEDNEGYDDVLDHGWKKCLLPEYSMLASDGNPVRHSLLNLADPEDIPELLAAMAEEQQFVFEDYSSASEMASVCGIMQLSEKRKSKQCSGRITFVEDPPQVFAYLDESSAREDGEWHTGCAITFEDYQKMSQSVQEEAAEQQLELARWRQTMQKKYSDYQDDSLSKPIKQLIIGQDTSVLKNKTKVAS